MDSVELKTEIFGHARFILEVKGTIDTVMGIPRASFTASRSSQSAQINYYLIEALLDETLSEIRRLSIRINVTGQTEYAPFSYASNTPIFRLAPALYSSQPSWAIVYFWSENPVFYRPGKWVKFFDEHYKSIYRKAEKGTSLDKEPIDDDQLFWDVNLG